MMSKNQKNAFESKREDEIKGFGNVDIITKLWDKKINELWMNFGTKQERSPSEAREKENFVSWYK
jgi:hypothetical protein